MELVEPRRPVCLSSDHDLRTVGAWCYSVQVPPVLTRSRAPLRACFRSVAFLPFSPGAGTERGGGAVSAPVPQELPAPPSTPQFLLSGHSPPPCHFRAGSSHQADGRQREQCPGQKEGDAGRCCVGEGDRHERLACPGSWPCRPGGHSEQLRGYQSRGRLLRDWGAEVTHQDDAARQHRVAAEQNRMVAGTRVLWGAGRRQSLGMPASRS